jgi:hypothetical protein
MKRLVAILMLCARSGTELAVDPVVAGDAGTDVDLTGWWCKASSTSTNVCTCGGGGEHTPEVDQALWEWCQRIADGGT